MAGAPWGEDRGDEDAATSVAGGSDDPVDITISDADHDNLSDLDAPPSGDESMLGLLGDIARAPATAPPIDLTAGTVVDGTFRVIRQLGAGGMGVVYLARDLDLQRDVALKIHRASQGLDRLQREAVAMAQLAHPNVLTVHAVGQIQHRLYIAMEYVPGATLRSWLEAEPRSWRSVVALLTAAGEGLAAAHDAGFVHRDFKPDNVLVGRDGRPRVGDFGLVRVAADTLTSSGIAPAVEVEPEAGAAIEVLGLAETVDHRARRRGGQAGDLSTARDRSPSTSGDQLTATGAAMGTPAYMAPEQFAGGDVDARADQFAFCVVLFEALCGRRPFRGDSYAALRAAVSAAPAPAPRGRAPAWLWRVLRRGLAADPAARWPDMRALLAALRAGPRQRRRAVAVAVAAVVAAGGAGWLVTRPAHGVAPAPSCGHASALVDDVWNPAKAGALAVRFLELDPLIGASFADRATRNIDNWVARYRSVTELACRASTIDRTWTARTAASSRCCSRRAVLALDRRITRAMRAERELLPMVTSDVRSPFAVEDCLDERLLLADYQSPADPADLPLATELDETLNEIDTMRHVGRTADGWLRYEAVRPQIEQMDFPLLTAKGLLVQGNLAMTERRLDVAVERFEQAYAIGRAGGADAIALSAAAMLIWVKGVEQQQVEAARTWIVQALPEAERYGFRHQAAAQVLHAAAVVAEIEASYERAIELNRKWVAAVRGVDDVLYASTLVSLGSALDAAGRSQEALDVYGEALDIYERDYGREHPVTVPLRSNIVIARIAVGDLAGGLAVAEAAVALLERIPASDRYEAVTLRFNHAFALQLNDRPAEAVEVLREVRAVYVELGGEDSPDVADVDANLGRLYLTLERDGDARRHLEHALTVRRGLFGEDHDLVADVYTHLGDLEMTSGSCARAVPHFVRSIAGFRAVAERGGVVLDRIAGPLIGLGRCRLTAGRHGDAIGLFTEARQHARHPHQVMGAVRLLGWALAAAGKPGQARVALVEARDLLTGDDPAATAERQKIDRWLAAHP